MYVIKADGSKERFDERKIVKTCRRAGASRETAERITEEIKKRIHDGTTTREIYKMILSFLRKTEKLPAFLFRLREALAELDSISFELYTKKVLESYSYKCKWNVIVKGKYVGHQIDLIAEKGNLFLVECKHHFNHHRFCGLGNVLQVQARLEDVNDGFRTGKNRYNFKQAWIITNTKFSEHAKKYARGKNIQLTGWRHKGEYALDKLIESKRIFPITILNIDSRAQKELSVRGIITLQDLLSADKRLIRRFKLESAVEKAGRLIMQKWAG